MHRFPLARVAFLVGVAFLVSLKTLPAVAQTTTGSISGTIVDATGGVLPGAAVSAINIGTGIKRTTTSNADGRFYLPELPPGSYELAVALQGFDSLVRKGITLTVGQQASLTVPMTVGAVSEQVTVTGEAPLIATTESTVSGLVEEKRIQQLPLNGRDFSQLALVEPGVLSTLNTRANDASKGFGGRISFAGSRPHNTGWLMDGMNIKGVGNFGTPGSSSGLLLGVDAVREFQVLTTNYSAEFGGDSGGVINMVTKSGTNQLHGSVYEFHRNDNFDARSFFDRRKPEFKRNQFGFSIGGPIRKDKTFFFGNYESLRERLGLTNIANVPEAYVHDGRFPNAAGILQQFQIAPEIKPFLDIWPLPNGRRVLTTAGVPTGFAELSTPGSQRTNQHYFMSRVDHSLTDAQSLFGRFAFDQGDKQSPYLVPIVDSGLVTRTRYMTAQLVSIWSPTLLSTSRVGYSRTLIGQTVLMQSELPAGVFFLNPSFPSQIVLPGAAELGPSAGDITGNVLNDYQFQTSFTLSRGDHSLKFGFDIQKQGWNTDGGPRNNGVFEWSSVPEFLEDAKLATLTSAVPGNTTQRSLRQLVMGYYVHDDWKASPRLTLNLGVRYEPYTAPSEKWDRISVVKDWVTATKFETNVGYWKNASLKSFAPRVGFAWDSQGNGKTVLRGGFGLFYQPLLGSYYNSNSRSNPPYSWIVRSQPLGGNFATAKADITRLGPLLLTDAFNADTFIEFLPYHPHAPYEMKFHVTVERQLTSSLAVSLGYLGGRGIHLSRGSEINGYPSTTVNGREFVAPGTPAPNPRFARGAGVYLDAQSFYNGLQLQVKKRLSQAFQFQFSYSWSKAIDDSSNGGGVTDFTGEGYSSRMYSTKADRGLSAVHQSQNLVVNGLWEIPAPQGLGPASYVLKGWQISGILTAHSGTPFSASESGQNVNDNGRTAGNSKQRRPDWIGGRSFESIIDPDNPDLYFDPTAFTLPPAGFYGNLGRNTFIGPGLLETDFSLQKSMDLKVREGARLEFRADFFNIQNRANFAVPANRQVWNATRRTPIGTAGRITSTVTSARQLQFGLRLAF